MVETDLTSTMKRLISMHCFRSKNPYTGMDSPSYFCGDYDRRAVTLQVTSSKRPRGYPDSYFRHIREVIAALQDL